MESRLLQAGTGRGRRAGRLGAAAGADRVLLGHDEGGEAGDGAGDGVALLCANRPEFAEALYAAQRAGLRLTPINWHLGADEIASLPEFMK